MFSEDWKSQLRGPPFEREGSLTKFLTGIDFSVPAEQEIDKTNEHPQIYYLARYCILLWAKYCTVCHIGIAEEYVV